MTKSKTLLACLFISPASIAFAGGTVAPAPVEAPAYPAPLVVAPAPIVMVPTFLPSWYGGIGLGLSEIKDVKSFSFANANGSLSIDNKDVSFKLFEGYRFNPHFAIEFSYDYLGKAKGSASVASGANSALPGFANGSIQGQAVTLDAVAMLPVAYNFDLFGKLGGYYAHVDAKGSVVNFPGLGTGSASTSSDNGGLHYGIGADFHFTNRWGVRLEWERFRKVGDNVDLGGESDINNTSISAIYNF